MFETPLFDETGSTPGEAPLDDIPRRYLDKRLVPLVLDMKVRWWVVGVVHANVDAKEIGNDWHEIS